VIFGLNYAYQFDYIFGKGIKNKNILWFAKYFFIHKIGINEFWQKPLFDCVVCMSSVYSLPVFWWFYEGYGVNFHTIGLYLIYIPALAGLNYLIGKFILE
jgi:hypothetical protein